ncbi:MAG: hypothetical protein ABIE23_02755, partial [archaeon]
MTGEINSFHNFQKIHENLVKRYQEDETISKENKALLNKYLQSLYNDDIKLSRVNKVFYQTYFLTKKINKDWSKVTREDLENL